MEGVVALGLNGMRLDVQGAHLCVGNAHALLVGLVDEPCSDLEAWGGPGTGGVGEEGVEAVQRPTGPVLRDFAEEAVLDGVPLGSARGVVGNGDDQTVRVAQAILDLVLEGATPVAVAATAVGQDQEFGGVRIASLALIAPPALEVVGGELGRVVRGSHVEGAAVGEDVVDAVGHGESEGVGTEVVVVDEDGRLAPGTSRVLEVADEFLLLGVDGNDRLTGSGEAVPELGDVAELLVSVRIGAAGELLVIDPKGKAELPEDLGYRVRADLDVEGLQLVGDLLRGASGPLKPGYGIPGPVMFEESLDGLDYLGRFFSEVGRPPPLRRTRCSSTSKESSSFLPRATVPGSRPRSSAILWSPP